MEKEGVTETQREWCASLLVGNHGGDGYDHLLNLCEGKLCGKCPTSHVDSPPRSLPISRSKYQSKSVLLRTYRANATCGFLSRLLPTHPSFSVYVFSVCVCGGQRTA